MAKKDITKERIVYKPFEYPTAFDYWLKQHQAIVTGKQKKG